MWLLFICRNTALPQVFLTKLVLHLADVNMCSATYVQAQGDSRIAHVCKITCVPACPRLRALDRFSC